MFEIGDKVKVVSGNDNENYDSFRDEVLIVTSWIDETDNHPAFDMGMEGERLYDLVTEDGKEIGCSLYDYELELA